MLVLVASAFLLYAASDLAFAVQTAQGDFHFGTPPRPGVDRGLLHPDPGGDHPCGVGPGGPRPSTLGGPSDAVGTTLVFSLLLVAAVVQVLFGLDGDLKAAQSVLWVALVSAAGARQIMLTSDNAALRRGLERRVLEQTADLRRLARQNEVLITSVGRRRLRRGPRRQGDVRQPFRSRWPSATRPPTSRDVARTRPSTHLEQDGTPYPWSECYINEAITHGLLATAEDDEYVRADGSTFPVEITASPLMDESEVRGAVVVFRDVTQRREVDRMKNEFLVGGQSRAAHAADLHPGLPRAPGRRSAGRAARAGRVAGRRRRPEQRAAHPPDQRPAGHRADGVGLGPDERELAGGTRPSSRRPPSRSRAWPAP